MQIEQDLKLIEWLNNIEASDATRSLYILFMRVYCERVGKTPAEFIAEAIKEIKEGKLPAERKDASYIASFKQCMKEKGYADKSFAAGMAAIRSFYKSYDIILSNGAAKTKKAKPKKENQNFLSKTDVQKILVNAKNLREKAVMLMMATSGMAIKEIVNLRIGDISIDTEGIGTISVRRNKTGVDFTTFISPEATKALVDYWDERDRAPDDSVKVHDEKGKLKPDEPVFINYGNRHKGGQINTKIMCKHFRELGEELGYGGKTDAGKGRKSFSKSRSHALRKYFITTLKNAGMPSEKVDFMAGHTRPEVDEAYNDIDISKLKDLYITYLPYLQFEKEIKVHSLNTEDQKRLEELKNENQTLNTKISVLEKKITETEDSESEFAGQNVEMDKEIVRLRNIIDTIVAELPEVAKKVKSMKASQV